jgi:hydrocephalus-inducing protein
MLSKTLIIPMQVNSTDFVVDKSVNVAPPGIGGTEVGVEVTFEPTRLGDTQAMLVISSSSGGEYVFPLYGHCLPPKPQGPFVIKPGHTINIPFKNVFSAIAQFKFNIDNPAFTVRPSDTIKPGRTYNISVTYDGSKLASDAGVVKVGKMTVTNVLGKGKATPVRNQGEVSWVYYLRGALEQSTTSKH